MSPSYKDLQKKARDFFIKKHKLTNHDLLLFLFKENLLLNYRQQRQKTIDRLGSSIFFHIFHM
jgi:hypothetical protein